MKLYIAETWERHESAELVGVFDTTDAAINAAKTKMKDYGQVYWVELNELVSGGITSTWRPDHRVLWETYTKKE